MLIECSEECSSVPPTAVSDEALGKTFRFSFESNDFEPVCFAARGHVIRRKGVLRFDPRFEPEGGNARCREQSSARLPATKLLASGHVGIGARKRLKPQDGRAPAAHAHADLRVEAIHSWRDC